jgi:transketolase
VSDLERESVNTIRTLAMDAVQKANSGHPGMPMGCAPLAYVLFNEVLVIDPLEPEWIGRDRFILSAGHGSMLLYASMHLAGFARPTLDDIKAFRQWGSVTAGHPESFELPGVETTTGPLGQGFANGVGMAMAAERLGAEFNRPGHDIVDHRIYAIVSDGDLMEGISGEAASLAGTLGLGKLVYFWDDNNITIDGSTDLSFTEDVLARFDAYGWHTSQVTDVTDLDAVRQAVKAAQDDDRPSLVSVRTVIGHGSPAKAGTSGAHGAPLGEDEIVATKAALGWKHPEPFTVPEAVKEHMDITERGSAAGAAWDVKAEAYRQAYPELAAEYGRRMNGVLPANWQSALPVLEGKAATRQHSGSVINGLASTLPELFGGSADLAGSNNTDIKGGGDFSRNNREGRNIRFGVREHAMGAIANGMTLHGGVIPYVATFLVFTDYCRPAIRLAAIMGLKGVWVMTHDSIGVGEDGPTHQPIEHIAALRAIPGVQVFRPADGNEVVGAWKAALEHDGPTVIALTRQGLPDLGTDVEATATKGGYVLRDVEDPMVVLIGTGSETHLAVEAAERLGDDGIRARVVSLPCWERFVALPATERDAVLPVGVPRVSIEAASPFGWERIVGAGTIIGIDHFGASAPAGTLFKEFGITVEAVVDAAKAEILG